MLDDFPGHWLGVTIKHAAIVSIEQRIFDANGRGNHPASEGHGLSARFRPTNHAHNSTNLE
ncbi:MAG TPA: hypothetical protein VLS26_11150, partial [Azonexus sp.]|nr:hypothetical protein [Azonexus sp.]